MKCTQCGKLLTRDPPFMLTANIADTNTGFGGIIQVPVCNQKCAEAYIERVKKTVMGTRLDGRQGS